MGSRAKLQPPTILVHFQCEGTLLVAFKMHGLKHQKRPFFTLARLLWGSKP